MSAQNIQAYHAKLLAESGGQWFDFEGLVRDIYTDILKPGDFALDVGVNEGVHFHQIRAAIGRTGRIVGIEAIPQLASHVLQRLAPRSRLARIKMRLGLLKPNFEIHNVAVSNYEGTATFSYVKGSTGLSSLAKREVANAYAPEEIIVPVTTIDALLAGIDRPIAFTKMDIEGAEYNAMQKGLKIFRDRSPIVFEFDRDTPKHFNFNADDMVNFIRSFDYQISDFFGNVFETGDDMLASGVWNYFAAPVGGVSPRQVRAIVARSLARQNIALPPLG